MPYTNILIHFVWSTKNRQPFLTPEKRPVIQQHIMSNAKKNDICIIALNSYMDHVHCLIALGIGQNPSEIMRLIKGESAFWINKHKLFNIKFKWQKEFYAVSVSEGGRENVINYIRNQDDHHKGKTFQKEYEEFM